MKIPKQSLLILFIVFSILGCDRTEHFIDLNNNLEIDAYAEYGGKFPCAVSKKNHIFGVQFHPEKSHNYGIQVLKNFSNL